MPYPAIVCRTLIASPSDVEDERRAIPEIIQQWNRDNSFLKRTVLDAVKWETHSTPAMGDRPQEILNKQVVRGCDILIGVFWARLGSPTGKEPSGTVEEIREFIAAGKPVLLYFSGMPIPQNFDAEQWQQLQEFKKECQSRGVVFLYESIDELRELLRSHLSRTVEELKEADPRPRSSTPEPNPTVYEQVERRAAILSFRFDFEAFLRRVLVEWSAERDSEPYALDDAKLVLRRVADDLIEYRSRIVNDAGPLPDLLADATKRLKKLQRHEVFLDGGVSYAEFWREGDEILLLLEVVPTSLDDLLQTEQAVSERNSMRRAASEEIEFNRQHLSRQEYSTPLVLRTDNVGQLLETNSKLPERLVLDLRTYLQNIRAARDVHRATQQTAGDFTPELLKIEELLKIAQVAGANALSFLQVLLQYSRRS
jgi:hypothetical protein